MSVKAFTLDGLTNAVGEITKAIYIKELELNYTLAVVTQGEIEYDITVLEPLTGRVRVKGGRFTEPIECNLNGSTMGGSMLWVGRIAIGMCVEFLWDGKTLITSPVKIIGFRIDPPAAVSKNVH